MRRKFSQYDACDRVMEYSVIMLLNMQEYMLLEWTDMRTRLLYLHCC